MITFIQRIKAGIVSNKILAFVNNLTKPGIKEEIHAMNAHILEVGLDTIQECAITITNVIESNPDGVANLIKAFKTIYAERDTLVLLGTDVAKTFARKAKAIELPNAEITKADEEALEVALNELVEQFVGE